MTPFGTYYYPPCAGTGAFLFTNPPFKMTDQPITPGLPGLSEEKFLKIAEQHSITQFATARYQKALFDLARSAYQRGADDQLEACARWLEVGPFRLDPRLIPAEMRDAMRPKPPSPKEQALAILEDCSLTPAQKSTIREALEALPE